MGVKRGIEEVQPVEFAEDDRLQNVSHGEGVVWMGFLNTFKFGNRAVVLEVVEVI